MSTRTTKKKPRAKKATKTKIEQCREHFRSLSADEMECQDIESLSIKFRTSGTQVYKARKQVLAERESDLGPTRAGAHSDISGALDLRYLKKVSRDLRTLRAVGSSDYIKGLLALIDGA